MNEIFRNMGSSFLACRYLDYVYLFKCININETNILIIFLALKIYFILFFGDFFFRSIKQ
jgi:hypothetical protein